jgi:hypothetical protein
MQKRRAGLDLNGFFIRHKGYFHHHIRLNFLSNGRPFFRRSQARDINARIMAMNSMIKASSDTIKRINPLVF